MPFLPRFALDQNFPTPILNVVRRSIVEAELKHIREVDERLSDLDDPPLIVALALRGFRALVTSDAKMLSQPRVLSALRQTGMALVVTAEAGHDSIKAAGMFLTYLPFIAQQLSVIPTSQSRVWLLKVANRGGVDPRSLLDQAARHKNTTAQRLLDEHALTDEELSTDPIG